MKNKHPFKLPPLPLNETTPCLNTFESIVQKQRAIKILNDSNNLLTKKTN